MTRFSFTVITLLIFAVAAYNTAAEPCLNESITWLEVEHPPYHFISHSSAQASEGILNQQREKLIKQLPCPWQHKTLTVNYARAENLLQADKNVLYFGLVKSNARERSGIAFSHYPTGVFFTSHFVILKSTMPVLSDYIHNGAIDLPRLLNSKSTISIGIRSGQSYAEYLDKLFRNNKDHPMLYSRYSPGFSGLYGMLKNGRIQALIDAPQSMHYWADFITMAPDLLAIPIANKPGFGALHVAAPKNAWGIDKLKLIDTILAKPENILQSSAITEKWLSNGSLKARYRNLVGQFYLDTYDIDLHR